MYAGPFVCICTGFPLYAFARQNRKNKKKKEEKKKTQKDKKEKKRFESTEFDLFLAASSSDDDDNDVKSPTDAKKGSDSEHTSGMYKCMVVRTVTLN